MWYLNAEKLNVINQQLSDKVSQKFAQPIKARYFETSQLALYDVAQGLVQFLSHKPKVSVIRKGTSLFEGILGQFYRMQTPLIFKSESDSIETFVNQLDHEVNCTLWSSENEITGEIFLNQKQRQNYHQLLSSRRIFSIEIKSYINSEDLQILKENPYAVIIATGSIFNSDDCLVLHTDKLKTPFLVAQFQKNLSLVFDELDRKMTKFFFDQDHFFAQNAELGYLKNQTSDVLSLKDRVVYSFDKINAAYLVEQLSLSDNQAFAPSLLPVWLIESFQSWWAEAQSEKFIRGLLVLKLSPDTQKLLIDIKNENDKLTKVSSWII